MRPGQQNKRGRGRSSGGGGGGGNNRKGQNPLSRTYDSSGPDVKIRGTAQTVAEKYMNLARDAQSAGDRVMAENYLQHAEHYNRIVAAAQAQVQERHQRDDRDSGDSSGDGNGRFDSDSDDTDDTVAQENGASGSSNGERPAAEARRESNPGEGEKRGRKKQDRQSFDPDAPQPVIEGVPAEVALEQDAEAEGGRTGRRRARPRRQRTEDKSEDNGSATGAGRRDETSAEAAPAE